VHVVFFQVKCTVVINRRSDLCYEISEYSFIFGLSWCIDGLFYIQSFIELVYNRLRKLM